MKGVDWRSGRVRYALTFAGVLVAAALVARGIFGPNGLPTYLQKRREYATLRRQIQQMKQEDQHLQKEVQGLRSDPATIERHAREDLHMAREHEKIYVLPQQSADPAAADLARQSPGPSNP